jgi:hypothetical protein
MGKQDEGWGPRIERTSASNQMPDKTLKQREVTVDAKRGKGSKDLLHEIASSSLCQNPRRGPQPRGLIVTRMGRCISSPFLLMRFSSTMRQQASPSTLLVPSAVGREFLHLSFFCFSLFIQRASRPQRQGPPPSSRQECSTQQRAQPQMRSRESESVSIYSMRKSPKGKTSYQVVSEKLHDESGVLVTLFAQGVELCGALVFVQLPCVLSRT